MTMPIGPVDQAQHACSIERLSNPRLSLGLRWIVCLGLAVVLAGPVPGVACADDAAADEETATETEEQEEQAFVVPEGSPDELFDFIQDVMSKRGRDRDSMFRSARAVVDAAQKIVDHEDADEDTVMQALNIQWPALSFLANYQADARQQLADLLERHSKSDLPRVRQFIELQQLKSEISGARTASAEEQQALIDRVMGIIETDGIDRSSYSLASSLARNIGYSDHPELGAEMYERLAKVLSESDDPQFQQLADKAMGSARRMRLPGNAIEVKGTTADGTEFDWDQYRGKVVLVDFWASWCGPCKSEIPNMKRALQAYPDDFTIIGINMDSSIAAMEKCIEQFEIDWVNLVGDEENGMGWDHPMATYYGITGIPTAILVDREGKVVSLAARGIRLNNHLEELIGPPADIEPDDGGSPVDAEGDAAPQEDGESAE